MISAVALRRVCALWKAKLTRRLLQVAVRLVTREQEMQQQRTSIKSSTLFEIRYCGDEEEFSEDACVHVDSKAPSPNVRLERKTPQAPPEAFQKEEKGDRKRAVAKEVAPAVCQQCECTVASNLLVGDFGGQKEREVLLPAPASQ